MDWIFQVVGADSVRAVLASGPSVLQEALDDAMPSGQATAWSVARWAVDLLDRPSDSGTSRATLANVGSPFAEGNITHLPLRGNLVIASYDFASEENGEPVDAGEFLSLLTAWRAAVISFDPESEDRLPPLREAIPL